MCSRRLLFTAYTLPPDKLAKAIEYARARNGSTSSRRYTDFSCWPASFTGKSARAIAPGRAESHGAEFLQAYIFAPLLLLTIDLFELPVSMRYHQLALKYDQSIERWGPWLWDWTKGEAIDLVVGGFVVWLLYAIIRRSPQRWWFYGWLAAIPLVILGVFATPLIIEPLFYRFTPLVNGHPALTAELEKVTARGGLEIPRDRIFEMNASEKVKSINAYVTGIGASKRVVVWDTTLRTMTTGQTLFIFGHEMGHYVLHHIWIGIALSCLGISCSCWSRSTFSTAPAAGWTITHRCPRCCW